VNTLKAKIMLLLLVLVTMTVVPTVLHADGNPSPLCQTGYCLPPTK
jgi:hypothetical protein